MDCLDDNAINAYVERRMPPDERARVEEHLVACEQCLTIACATAQAPSSIEPLRRIGRYVPIELIGQGGMGSVYVAHDPQLDRSVALKLVRSERSVQPAMQARLEREARAMAKVRHPNVVTIHDVGEHDDAVFLAMELVDGETLRRWLAREPRSWREIVRVFAAAGRGLEAAHGAGIVHRDFKPDNVLVERTGRVAVGDFGVAALAEEAALATIEGGASPALAATQTGAMLGTPRYMAPEQFRGERVDARTDQFGFAVALYEALYGTPPFAGTTAVELARTVTAGRLEPPPRRATVPRRLHRVLVRALSTDREARYASMGDLLEALQAAARRRWRAPAIVAAIAAAAVVAAVVAFTGRDARAPDAAGARRTLVLIGAFDNATGEAELDGTLDAITGTVLQTSTRVDAVFGAALQATAQRFELPAPDVDAIAARYAGDPRPIVRVRGRITPDGAGFRISLDAGARFAGARPAPSRAALVPAATALATELLAALGDRSARPELRVLSDSIEAIHAWSEGQLRALAGDQAGAAERCEHALRLDPEFVEARAAYGLTLYNLQRKMLAAQELERAFRGAGRMPERQRLGLLGDYYGTVGRYSEAIMAYQQLLAKWPSDARTQINLTATALDGNSWPLALEAARAAAADHGEIELVRRNLVLAELGNELFADAIRDAGELVAKAPRPSGIALASLASAYALAGRIADARAAAARVAAYDPDLAAHAVADVAAFEGRLDDAAAALAGRTGQADQLVRAWIELRRGDRARAAADARAAASDDSMPLAYLAASAAVAAGDLDGADAKVRAWAEMPESDHRMYAQVLAGDLAVAARRWSDAIAAYTAAGRLGESWLVHERLARALLGAGAHERAEQELRWCLDHRGQAALVANPSLALLPEVYLMLAQSREARRADGAEIRAAYQAVVELAPAPQGDPWTAEARARLAALPP